MTLQRRRFIGLIAAGSTLALTGCGGGGGGGGDRGGFSHPTRFVWLLNIHPEFASADIAYGSQTLVSGLPSPALTPALELDFGIYTVGVRDRISGRQFAFDDIVVDDLSPSIDVFYRAGNSARLGASPAGIVNYFDSGDALVVELDDGFGAVQTTVLAFEGSAEQASGSRDVRLRLRRASDGVLVYDSGLRRRPRSIVIFPADPVAGFVGVVALDYGSGDAVALNWPDTL